MAQRLGCFRSVRGWVTTSPMDLGSNRELSRKISSAVASYHDIREVLKEVDGVLEF